MKRDKLGRFALHGDKPKPRKGFYERYMKITDKMLTEDDIAEAYLDGFRNGRTLKQNISAGESLKAWRARK